MTDVAIRAFADGDWPAAEAARAPARREASGLVAALLQWHLERGLRSLTLVDRGAAPADPPARPTAAAAADPVGS